LNPLLEEGSQLPRPARDGDDLARQSHDRATPLLSLLIRHANMRRQPALVFSIISAADQALARLNDAFTRLGRTPGMGQGVGKLHVIRT